MIICQLVCDDSDLVLILRRPKCLSDGRPRLVAATALRDTFGAVGSSVKLVVLNACYSDVQAEALLAHVDCVIGMSGSISDDAARSFAIGFYGGLGERGSVATAYEQGRVAISLEALHDSDRPQLKFRNDVDVHRLILAEIPPVGSNCVDHDPAGLAVIATTMRPGSDFPILDITIKNPTSRSQILTTIELDVVDYFPTMSAPLTRALLPLATWDIIVPRSVGRTSLPAPAPILIAADDAAVLSVRLSCVHDDMRTAPRDVGLYTIQLAFRSDRDLGHPG